MLVQTKNIQINEFMLLFAALLANQGIDDDSALRISNIEALPGALRGAYASSSPKPKFDDMKDDTTSMSKQNVASFNQDEYMLDANSWPEYKIKDSDYMNRNFRVFPQGPNEGEGGFQGGMMPYGARGKMEEGMEGPYGDGNYGYPQPPQMASDQPSPPQMPDEGSQITSIPMNEANKVQRLVMKNNKHKHPASENFNDMTAVSSKGSSDKGLLHSAEGVSGSGEGSGSSDPNVKGNKAPSSPKGTSDTPKASNMKSQEKVGGKGEVGADVGGKGAAASSAGGGGGGGTEGGSGDTTGAVGAGKTGSDGTEGTEAAATGTKANSENSEILSSQSKPEPTATSTKTPTPEKAKQTGDKTQNPTANGKSDSTNSKTESNASTGTPDSNLSSAKGSTAKEITNALSKAQGNTPLGEFAEFLKSKGITLTINKDKAMANSNSNDAPTPDKESQPSSTTAQSAPPPESMLASVLPTTGESLAQTSSNTNTNSKANDSQASSNNLDNAVMNWQNIAPQNAGQIGELFLRQSTKQGHN